MTETLLMPARENAPRRLDCPVYLINLDGSDARLQFSTQQLNEAGVSFERVSAIDGRGVSPDHFDVYNSAESRRYYGRDMTSGEIGCYLSHVMVLNAFLKTGEEYCVVFEDDFLVKPGAWETVDLLENCIRQGGIKDWDLINLTREPTKFRRELLNLADDSASGTLFNAYYFPTRAAAIMWSKDGAKRFLEKSEVPLCPIDHLFRKRVSEDLRGLGIIPTPFWFTGIDSDIENASPDWKKPAGLSWYRVKEAARQIKILAKSYKKWLAH